MATTDISNTSADDWYLDSGDSDHMISKGSFFTELDTYRSSGQGISGGVEITGEGTVQHGEYNISNAYHAPGMPCNLFSVPQMTKASGQAILFTSANAYAVPITPQILDSGHLIASKDKWLYKLLQ